MVERCVHLKITGRVQGVWFRGWTQQQATSLNVRGWVRNRTDGSVEAVFVGAIDNVEELIERCRSGPPLARVDHVDIAETVDEGFVGFSKQPTV